MGIPIETLLGLSVLAAIVGALGSLLGTFIKEYLLTRSFESWKEKKDLERIFRQYRNPLMLAADELCTRLIEIIETPFFLDSSLLKEEPEKILDFRVSDPYYRKYRLVSNAYRFCALLGWLELYRRQVVFIDSGKSTINRILYQRIEDIRSDLADGQLNTAEDWEKWHDRAIFREEQREIGAAMIVQTEYGTSMMEYAIFRQSIKNTYRDNNKRWLRIVLNFLLDPDFSSNKNFHLIRLKRLIVHLVDLMELLDHSRVKKFQRECKEQIEMNVEIRPAVFE